MKIRTKPSVLFFTRHTPPAGAFPYLMESTKKCSGSTEQLWYCAGNCAGWKSKCSMPAMIARLMRPSRSFRKGPTELPARSGSTCRRCFKKAAAGVVGGLESGDFPVVDQGKVLIRGRHWSQSRFAQTSGSDLRPQPHRPP